MEGVVTDSRFQAITAHFEPNRLDSQALMAAYQRVIEVAGTLDVGPIRPDGHEQGQRANRGLALRDKSVATGQSQAHASPTPGGREEVHGRSRRSFTPGLRPGIIAGSSHDI